MYSDIYQTNRVNMIATKEEILSFIDEHKEEYINFLEELIKTTSYNPPGDEMNVAVKIHEYLEDLDMRCDVHPFGDNRANLIAYFNEETEGKNLLYNGHMDVVPPGEINEWKKPPLSAYIKRKKIMYGRGTADMKGGLTAMVIALKVLKSLGIESKNNVILNAVADEETGGVFGTKMSLDEHLHDIKCDFCIVGEPSGINPLPKAIILGEKGHLQLRIIANGASCHASTPFLGENAIYMIGKIIQNLDRLDELIPEIDPPLSEERIKNLVADAFPSKEIFETIYQQQELLQNVVKSLTQFTKSLTMIKGGIKENVVPDKCEAVIDFRLLPGQKTDVVIQKVKQLVNELGYEVRDTPDGKPEDVFMYFEIIHQSEASYWDGWEDSKDLENFHEILSEVYGKTPFYFLYPACADAHYYRNTGYCPQTVLFGPGSAATAHATDEFIEIEDFLNAIKTYTLFAYEFLKSE